MSRPAFGFKGSPWMQSGPPAVEAEAERSWSEQIADLIDEILDARIDYVGRHRA